MTRLHNMCLACGAGGELGEVHAGSCELPGALPPELYGVGSARGCRLRCSQRGQGSGAVDGGVCGHQALVGGGIWLALGVQLGLHAPTGCPGWLLAFSIRVLRAQGRA